MALHETKQCQMGTSIQGLGEFFTWNYNFVYDLFHFKTVFVSLSKSGPGTIILLKNVAETIYCIYSNSSIPKKIDFCHS